MISRVTSGLYAGKEIDYFSTVRKDITCLVPDGPNTVLDVGCGAGGTLLELKESGKARETVGVDIVDLKPRGLDNFLHQNIEDTVLPYRNGYFDVIICADVLEHLYDPWGTVGKLAGYLKKGGILIASVPNIQEIRTLLTILLGGDFRYADAGILDRTHLRFFCKKNIIGLIGQAGLEVKAIHYRKSNWKRLFLDAITFGLIKDMLVGQYVMVAGKR